jgi:hypothetical protein
MLHTGTPSRLDGFSPIHLLDHLPVGLSDECPEAEQRAVRRCGRHLSLTKPSSLGCSPGTYGDRLWTTELKKRLMIVIQTAGQSQ